MDDSIFDGLKLQFLVDFGSVSSLSLWLLRGRKQSSHDHGLRDHRRPTVAVPVFSRKTADRRFWSVIWRFLHSLARAATCMWTINKNTNRGPSGCSVSDPLDSWEPSRSDFQWEPLEALGCRNAAILRNCKRLKMWICYQSCPDYDADVIPTYLVQPTIPS